MIIFFLLSIATASYFAAMGVSRKLAVPILELSEGARRVAAKDFNTPVSETAAFQEFHVLLGAFNQMTAELKKYHGIQLDKILQEKEKTEFLMRLMTDGVVLADVNGEILYINRVALVALGLPEHAGSGFRQDNAEQKKELKKRLAEVVLKQKESDSMTLPLSGSGRKGYFKVGIQIFAKGKQEPGMFVLMHDVTLEHELDMMKDDFFHSVAHDLRAPLLGMQGYIKLLEAVCGEEKEKEYVGALKRTSDKVFTLIQGILDLARMEAGNIKLKYSMVNPVELTERLKDIFGPVASQKNIVIEFNVENARGFEADVRL